MTAFRSNTKTFFAAATGAYRYWLTPASGNQHTVLKLHTSRALLNKFRNSKTGLALSKMVDICEIGCGWFEITGRDLTKLALTEFNKLFAAAVNGVMCWLKQFNLAHVGHVNANDEYSSFVTTGGGRRAIRELAKQEKVHRLEKGVSALAAKFGKVLG